MKYISLEFSPYADKVLTDQQLDMILWEDDIQATAPGTKCETTQKEVDSTIAELSGKTIKEYCHWRWPDNPEEQFLLLLEDLSEIDTEKGNVYAVYNNKRESIVKELSFKQAKSMSDHDSFIIPMDALNKE